MGRLGAKRLQKKLFIAVLISSISHQQGVVAEHWDLSNTKIF
jgi:hypothetical protein